MKGENDMLKERGDEFMGGERGKKRGEERNEVRESMREKG